MPLTRLLYFSENTMAAGTQALAGLRSIMSASGRNNEAAGITGALVFDNQWFLQALEGERATVWDTLRRIQDDERHASIVIIDARQVSDRLFGNWWMGLARRTDETASTFTPFLRNGMLRPEDMSADEILRLMMALSRLGFSRKLADAA